MYMMPEMINMGLKDNQEWPSEVHKSVAQHVCLCNNRVTSRDSLMEMVQKIIAIPDDRIKLVTVIDLATEFQVPFISLS